MLKKYTIYLLLGPLSNVLWALWVLPQINEQGTAGETLTWLCVQAFLPAVFVIFLYLKKRFIFWLLLVHSGFIILYAVGILGWSLMGLFVPASIYVVCGILFVMGFGILYHSISDLKISGKVKRYEFEDQ